MKKILAAVLAAFTAIFGCMGLTACGDKSDIERVKKNGKIIVGVTIYEPMDYKNENDEWVGFDAELAQQFAASLELDCEITVIVWDEKVSELNSKNIDLVWNGMTADAELGEKIDFSVSYAKNAQVAVVKSTGNITTKEQIKTAKVAVEKGSAGNTVATEEGMTNVQPVDSQVMALTEVTSGTSDVAIIDITMAQSVVGKGVYSGLKIVEGVSYGDEIFAVGLRKGSDLKAELDKFLKEKYADGTMAALAEKYSVGLNTEALGA